jgi:hypothetical protein
MQCRDFIIKIINNNTLGEKLPDKLHETLETILKIVKFQGYKPKVFLTQD